MISLGRETLPELPEVVNPVGVDDPSVAADEERDLLGMLVAAHDFGPPEGPAETPVVGVGAGGGDPQEVVHAHVAPEGK